METLQMSDMFKQFTYESTEKVENLFTKPTIVMYKSVHTNF